MNYTKAIKSVIEQYEEGAIMYHEMIHKIIAISQETMETVDYFQARIEDLRMREEGK